MMTEIYMKSATTEFQMKLSKSQTMLNGNKKSGPSMLIRVLQ